MAVGLLRGTAADVALATTGIAGPGGGAPATPVGTVWFAWARRAASAEPELVQTARHDLHGTRAEICAQAVDIALEGVLHLLR
jgi:nicotinamide-nucleotide amidase